MQGPFRVVSLGLACALVAGLLFVNLRDDSDPVTVQAAGAGTADTQTDAGEADTDDLTNNDDSEVPAEDPVLQYLINDGPAPEELVDIEAWFQTDATSLAEARGEVTIVKFWTFSCINCKRTIPHFQDLYTKYQDDGLEIIGVHAPEFDFERDLAQVQQAAVDQGVVWPIAIDNTKANFRSWQGARRFWPRYFVIDQNGDIRYDKIGEGKYDRLDAVVGYLLENPPEPITDQDPAATETG